MTANSKARSRNFLPVRCHSSADLFHGLIISLYAETFVSCALFSFGAHRDPPGRANAAAIRPGEERALLFLHSFGRAAARFGRAAEGGVVTAHRARVLELGDVAFSVPSDSQFGIAALACVCADKLGGLAVLH